MTKQVEDQKEIIKSKENAIENLLTRMDDLTAALTQKSEELANMKRELSMKDDILNVKDNKQRPMTSSAQSTKTLSLTTKDKSNRKFSMFISLSYKLN